MKEDTKHELLVKTVALFIKDHDTKLVYTNVSCTLRQAFDAMKEGGKGYVLLVDEKIPKGILTERD